MRLQHRSTLSNRIVALRLCVLSLCLVALSPGATARGATLETKGHAFLLDGRPFDLWGIRTASASQSEELTDHLIAQLDDYRDHGVDTVTVFYMGSSGGSSDPFTPDGRGVDPGHGRRMVRVIEECDRRGTVVIVGVFYQNVAKPRLKDWEASKTAVRTVAAALKPYRNVIVNVANEQNSAAYRRLPWSRVNDPDDVLDLCRIVTSVDPDRIVGAGGYDHEKNEVIGRSKDVNVLLFDTAGPEPSSGRLYERFLAAGIKDKPVVNVETFGGWTKRFRPQGVFPDEAKRAYRREVDDAARHEGLYVAFHNNPWCQASGSGEKIRYDLGGRGSQDDPGIRWYFEYVKARRDAPQRPAADEDEAAGENRPTRRAK